MALFDKLKETANTVKNKAVDFTEENNFDEKLGKLKDSAKKAWEEGTESFKATNAANKELKKPLDGAIIRYEVIYVGGLPKYTKTKHGSAIGMNLMEDRFAFRKTGTSKDWFDDMDIAYDKVKDIRIEKRTISTAEMLLGAGNDVNQQQENNICITFSDDLGNELMLRVEMLTGVTIYNQAAKCREFLDILRQKNILKMIEKNKSNNEYGKMPNVESDVFEQLEKLAKLKEKGILSDEEFMKKKEELLSKL